ncbi:MAG: POT family proton-dependent oligopeptide transporter [Enterobacterales bacterium]|jgi:POT family proton-dependent oligopeptide transporter
MTKIGLFSSHPEGLKTLFLTEMWERMSYYGMRAMLVYFMVATMQEGGLALTAASATAIYGLYTGTVYFMGLPGGWIADRLIGGQKAVWYGAFIIMCGHIVLAIPNDKTFFIGLILVILGTGLLKPNIGAMVGQLYSDNDVRRDSGYAIYYMGINIGSVIGVTVCGYLQVNNGFHMAFGAAAVGMALGLIQYKITLPKLEGVGLTPPAPLSPAGQKKSWMVIYAALATIAIVTFLTFAGTIVIEPRALAENVTIIFLAVFIIYYSVIYWRGSLTANEKKKLLALLLICIASTCFWAGFEQSGSSLSLFAKDFTNLSVGGFEVPPAWFQNANAFFIVLLSPFFAVFWIKLGQKLVTPSDGIKCAIGLMIMASGFIVMFFAAQYAALGMKVAPSWLIATYFLHTVGELCLSPVALSAVSKLAPKRFAGQMMGIFVLTYSIGNLVAGLLAGNYDPNQVDQIPALYIQISTFSIGIGIIILLFGLKTRYWEALPDDNDELSTGSTATNQA